MGSLQGHFLLAHPAMADPNFAQTVVLIVQHGVDGAVGLVMNRPMEVTVAEAVGEAVAGGIDEPLFNGGPCQGEGQLMVVHGDASLGGVAVLDDVRFTTERVEIETVMMHPDVERRFFAGYAGWGPSQLEDEIASGGWLTLPAARRDVFCPTDNWEQLKVRATFGRFIDPDRIPDDPSLN
ncbi:MAG: YqgE/AlgH family protein [Phycisphaerae bacterium]